MVILDGDPSVGRIYKEHGEARWFWSLNTNPEPAPLQSQLLSLTVALASHRKRRNSSPSNDMKS
jgi:hypothetical protein